MLLKLFYMYRVVKARKAFSCILSGVTSPKGSLNGFIVFHRFGTEQFLCLYCPNACIRFLVLVSFYSRNSGTSTSFPFIQEMSCDCDDNITMLYKQNSLV